MCVFADAFARFSILTNRLTVEGRGKRHAIRKARAKESGGKKNSGILDSRTSLAMMMPQWTNAMIATASNPNTTMTPGVALKNSCGHRAFVRGVESLIDRLPADEVNSGEFDHAMRLARLRCVRCIGARWLMGVHSPQCQFCSAKLEFLHCVLERVEAHKEGNPIWTGGLSIVEEVYLHDDQRDDESGW